MVWICSPEVWQVVFYILLIYFKIWKKLALRNFCTVIDFITSGITVTFRTMDKIWFLKTDIFYRSYFTLTYISLKLNIFGISKSSSALLDKALRTASAHASSFFPHIFISEETCQTQILDNFRVFEESVAMIYLPGM